MSLRSALLGILLGPLFALVLTVGETLEVDPRRWGAGITFIFFVVAICAALIAAIFFEAQDEGTG